MSRADAVRAVIAQMRGRRTSDIGCKAAIAIDGWADELDAALTVSEAPEQAKPRQCIWSMDDIGGESMWETQCGHAFEFNDGGPLSNGQRYCGYCGGLLAERYASELAPSPAEEPR